MKAPLREQLRAQSLPEDELSEAEQQLLRAVLDEEMQAKWAQALAEKGVHREATQVRLRRLRPLLAIAASMLVLAVAAWWLWHASQPDAQELAFDEIAQLSAPIGNFQRGKNNETDSLRSATYTAYARGDFQSALNGFIALIEKDSATIEDYVLAGFCALKSSNPDLNAALRYFLEARKLDSGGYAEDIRWYLGLTYAGLNEKEKALEELRAEASGGRKAEAARKLIKALQ
ncbi:MAG: hypothetical protein SH848_15455 [Saprospiraceae bacterium]|nr:hypothetical protein [Saprospiraceae bacterium]MDZ4705321.1 hypothetical protein [Saprospiraceae bacterium]